jgi:hypothetical protein
MSKKAYRLMSAPILANVLSVTAVSAAYATEGPGNPTDGTGRSHASAAPACGDQCPVPAVDDPPGVGDNDGRSGARMASDGPSGPGDNTGRSNAALSQRGGEFRVASIRGGATGDF